MHELWDRFVPIFTPPTKMKEVKRRTMFGGSAAVEKLLYPVFVGLNERLAARRIMGFAEIEVGSYHVAQTH